MRLKIQKDGLICLKSFKEVLNVGKDLLTLLKIKYDMNVVAALVLPM